MYKGKSVAVIIPAYNEEQSIGLVINDILKQKLIDKIVVVNNSSKDKTGIIAKSAGAHVITGIFAGYGDAIREGLANTSEDLLIVTEADNTFSAADIEKLLAYSNDSDLVLGTRTALQLINVHANMGIFLRWGNIFLGKFLQSLYGFEKYRFTDVGCTFRLISNDAYKKISSSLRCNGPEFSPEMIIEAAKAKMRIVEIPVNYGRRIGGESKYTTNKIKAFWHGLGMIWLILSRVLEKRRYE